MTRRRRRPVGPSSPSAARSDGRTKGRRASPHQRPRAGESGRGAAAGTGRVSGATLAAWHGLSRAARPRGPDLPPLPSAGPAGVRRSRDGERGGGRAPRPRPGAASLRGRGSLRAVRGRLRGRGSLRGAAARGRGSGRAGGGAEVPGRLREAPLSRSCLSPYRYCSSLRTKRIN